ncbi:MAG: NFACT family protein [Eubacterium sp.]
MAFDGVTVASLVSEFNKKIFNGRIYKIAQTESDELLLTIKVNQTNIVCLSVPMPVCPYFTGTNKPPLTAPNFVCFLAY